MKKAIIESVKICIPLTIPEFRRLENKVAWNELAERMGQDVDDIDYNGHFGANFFCTCPPDRIGHVEATLRELLDEAKGERR